MRSNARATRRVALFCLCLLPLACRQGNDTPFTADPIPFTLSFSPGDAFRYEALLIDAYGYYMPSTRSKAMQRIVSINGMREGMTGVITMLDSTGLLRDSSAVEQEFSLAQSSDGDLYRFGFLAEMARILGLPIPQERWDRMAAFSLGCGSSWVVGYLDTARAKGVYGSFVGVSEFCEAKVNGVQNVFPCYRIDVVGEGLIYRFWISDSPTGFLRYILEPGEGTRGFEMSLTEMQVRVR